MTMDVLKAVESGLNKPTRIFQLTNLSPSTCNRILGDLASKKLVTEKRINRLRRYRITDRGLKVLRRYEAFLNAYRGSGKNKRGDGS